MMTFGEIPPLEGGAQSALSDDKLALSMDLLGFEAIVDQGVSEPIVSRSFSVVLPLEGDGGAEVRFAFQLLAVVTEGAVASLYYNVNGQGAVRDFAAGTDSSFEERQTYLADASRECRLYVHLLVSRDSKSQEPGATLSLNTIDAEVAPIQSSPELA